MDLHVFNIVLAVIAAVGIPGAIAIAIFFPAAAEVIVGSLLRVFGRILGTPLGAGISAAVVFFIVGELAGTHEANVRCQATIISKEKAADAAAVERDRQQADLRSTEDQAAIDQLTSITQTQEAKLNDYAKQLAARPQITVCRLGDDDIKRMR